MLDFFKNLFVSKPSEEGSADERQPVSAKGAKQNQNQNAPVAPRPAAPRTPPPGANGNSVYLSLQSILNGLPIELKSRARQNEVGDATVSVPIEKIISQLSSGVVKIAFGDIRRAAAQVFSNSKDFDTVQVVLPLDEILAQIDPSILVRRENQKLIEVPEEISSPFGEHGQGLLLSAGPGKAPASLPGRVVAPINPSQSRVPARPVQPPPTKVQPVQSRVQPVQPKAPPVQPKAPPAPIQPIQTKAQPPQPLQPAQPKPQPFQPKVQPAHPVQPIQPQPIQRQPVPQQPVQPVARTPISTPMPPAPSKPSGPPAIPAPPELRSLGASLSTTTISRRTPAPQPPAAQKPVQPTPQPFMPPRPPTPPAHATPKSFVPAPAEEEEEPIFKAQPAVRPVPQAVPQAVPQPVSQPAKSESVLMTVPLSTLCEGWSEPLRQEIAQMRIADAKVALPAQTTEDAMKRGKLAFPWKVVRSWIKPAQVPTPSPHDNTVVELPLKVIAPLFLARKDSGKSQQKVAIDEEIPNLFFGFPQPEAQEPEAAPAPAFETPVAPSKGPAAAPAASKTVDTNYYVWDDTSDSAKVDEVEFKRGGTGSTAASSAGKTPGTAFVTRYATPNEVVSRAASLDGVSGALIALPDGLMVASKLSADLNADTLAAFLPHIFGKVSQCTKELRMGELNNLNFTVGNVPWKIFRVNAIFFAAFGRIGQPLPTAQLAALAAELDHKKQ